MYRVYMKSYHLIKVHVFEDARMDVEQMAG